MVAGLVRGLDHEEAARFSFPLATPVILAAGLYKVPDLFGPLAAGIRGQVIVGSLCAGVTAYFAVRFLMRYFETKTLTPVCDLLPYRRERRCAVFRDREVARGGGRRPLMTHGELGPCVNADDPFDGENCVP
jgi:Bacitracin resistance protein BacA